MTAISKNDTVNKYKDTCHKTVDVKPSIYIDFNKAINDKDLNLKLEVMLEYRNKKNIFAKGYVPN